ncbi:unnamed protein product [Linum trigynum]|uniref:F-box associated beta-propeller type 1 domain-containing protein n=1 Tax=Linum trigynum TaxID=586398 RepID=A0AAV2C8E1_9ROSI
MSAMPKHLCGDGDGVYHCGCGFGYDSVSDDYKVVKLNQMMLFSAKIADCFQSELISYGVRSGSSVVVKFPYILALTEKVGVFVGGAIHWVVHTPDVSNLIVGFDLGRNECKEIPQPEYRNEKSLLLRIGELEKCLCIFANYRGRVLDVWIMKEYGVEESWSKMLSVPHPGLCYDIRIRSLGYSMTGQELLLLLDSQRLVWYDLKKNPEKGDAAKEITISGLKAVFVDAIVCFGSLVSPHGKFPTKEEVKVDRLRKKRDGFLSSGFKLKL